MRYLFDDERAIALELAERIMRAATEDEDGCTEVDYNALHDIDFSSGATKVVAAIPQLSNWVVKFCVDDLYYCNIEANNYIKALEDGFADYFPTTYLLLEDNGFTFIIQEKCVCDESQVFSTVAADCDFEDEDYAESYLQDLNDYETIVQLFGDCRLANWMRDNDINDIHCANVGYLRNNLVIIDFSGF